MLKHTLLRAAIASTLMAFCTAANAGAVSFTGSLTGLAAAGPDASCAPLPVGGSVSANTASGTSSLGAFTYTHNICFNPMGGPFHGIFLMNFGADALSGVLNGTDSPDATPGVFDVNWTYTILAGTGPFTNASGTFTGIGTVDPRVFPAPLSLNFSGNIDVPSVPEPHSWAMMLIGFGVLGLAVRRNRRQSTVLSQLA